MLHTLVTLQVLALSGLGSPRARLARDDGQSTAEYALVLLRRRRRRPAPGRLGHQDRQGHPPPQLGPRPGAVPGAVRSSRRAAPRRTRGARGQSTVELALLLPVVVLLLLAVLQMGLLARDIVLVTHASREAARAAAVDSDPERGTAGGHRLDGSAG